MYNDDNIISDEDAKKYLEEMTDKKIENKILVQNLLNIVTKTISFIREEIRLLNELKNHISQLKQNELIVKVRLLEEQESSLNLLYELGETLPTIKKLNFNVKINQNKPLLKNALDCCCEIIKSYFSLLDFEINSKIQDIVKNYINEMIDIVMFLSGFLVL